mgnify:CR=1 FL=1
MAEMSIDRFMESWAAVVKAAMKRTERIAYIVSPAEVKEEGNVVDLAVMMAGVFKDWRVERRVIVPYNTQQATGQQVEWARKERKMLKLYRDLVVFGAS